MRSLHLLVSLAVLGTTIACSDGPTSETTSEPPTLSGQTPPSTPTRPTTPPTTGGYGGGSSSSLVSSTTNFVTQLSGEAEVQTPPVTTRATGVSKFQLSKDGSSLTYFVNVAQLENVRFAHLHLNAAGLNGPVVVDLRLDKVTGPVDGRYAEGTITAGSLKGPLLGQPLSALINAIESGRIYVNVHTDRYPAGELRGQVR